MPKLENGTPLPHFDVDTVAHGPLSLPDAIESEWAVVLFYRGHF